MYRKGEHNEKARTFICLELKLVATHTKTYYSG